MAKQSSLQPTYRVSDIIIPHKSVAVPHKLAWYQQIARLKWPLLLAVLIVVLLIALGVVFAHTRSTPDTGSAALQQAEREIGRHYLLPANEQPALVTVEDQTKIKAPFLRQAKNGDKLLVYANAKIVIIYRPSIDRIIAVGPVFIDTSKTDATQ